MVGKGFQALAFGFLRFLADRFVKVETVVGQVFAALDVILVLVRPVQVNLAPVIRHSIRRGAAVAFAGVITARHEVTVVVIALEKTVEMVVDFAFGIAAVLGLFIKRFGFFDAVCFFRVRRAESVGLFRRRFIVCPGFRNPVFIGFAESILNDFEQVVFQKVRNLHALGVHDFVKAKIQFRLVELEQLFQQIDQADTVFFGVAH
ncbi:hypothetical protein [Methylomicrobium agile]|uniref:hypothetical protein n=1 Tax=Methylomicrobium agile TaxID=39774 RepID=UPI001FE15A79|nr:hypothetical protein [Methylomicrobium agile]